MWKRKEPIKPKNLTYLCLHQNCTAISGRNFNKLRTVHSQAFIVHLITTENSEVYNLTKCIFVFSLCFYLMFSTQKMRWNIWYAMHNFLKSICSGCIPPTNCHGLFYKQLNAMRFIFVILVKCFYVSKKSHPRDSKPK